MEGGLGSSERGSEAVEVQWAVVAPGLAPLVVVATAERCFVHQPAGVLDDPFLGPMGEGPGAIASTRQLLDGAIAAARKSTPRGPEPPPLSPSQWVWRLAGYYRTTEPTARLLVQAAARFAAAGRTALAGWAARRAVEEAGHDRLALRDLEALGLDGERVVRALRPATAAALAERFTRACAEDDPIGCVGYSYALERLALGRDQGFVDRVQALLPEGVDATRCLRVHSAVGSDALHVEETVEVVAALPGPERAGVAREVFATACIYYSAAIGSALPDAQIDERVAGLRRPGAAGSTDLDRVGASADRSPPTAPTGGHPSTGARGARP